MEGKKNGQGKHICSNPNCGKIFSKPKIIRYYVCPSCQTLVDIPSQEIPDPAPPIKKLFRHAIKQNSGSELTQDQQVSNVEKTDSKESPLGENLDLKLELIPEFEAVNISSLEEKVQLAVEGRKVLSELNFPCNHYFGFLGEKKEGQGIPESCFECPKSVECLLSKSAKSEESIKEIKQWYNPNSP